MGTAKQVCSFIKEVLREFHDDNGALYAAAISFFGLTSLIPLLLLAVGIFGHIIGSYEQALQKVLAFAREFIPVGTESIEQNLKALSKQSDFLSGLGLLGLLWIGSQVIVILQQVMNVALGVTKPVGFLRARATALAGVVVSGALFALSIGITSLLTATRDFSLRLWGLETQDLTVMWDVLGFLAPVLISVLAFTFIYKFLPTRKVGTTGPIGGGVTAGLLFEAAKFVFRWYVASVANFSRVYGSLGGVIILVLWIYYGSLITVLGAEVASVYARREATPTGKRR